jgi:Sec-independent protein translocase protein TatA
MNVSISQIIIIAFLLAVFFGNFSNIIKNTANAIKALKDTFNKNSS